jgi:hypothetical protein
VSVTLCLSACAAFTPRAEGQTHMQAVERLYSSAPYEDALAALDTVDVAGDGERIESVDYRILCLLGMGERERAEAVIETMRWLPTGGGLQTVYFVTGAKVNIHGRWLLKANVLTRLTDTGLQAKFTPSIALDDAREF